VTDWEPTMELRWYQQLLSGGLRGPRILQQKWVKRWPMSETNEDKWREIDLVTENVNWKETPLGSHDHGI
jgi:hypothetical protein